MYHNVLIFINCYYWRSEKLVYDISNYNKSFKELKKFKQCTSSARHKSNANYENLVYD